MASFVSAAVSPRFCTSQLLPLPLSHVSKSKIKCTFTCIRLHFSSHLQLRVGATKGFPSPAEEEPPDEPDDDFAVEDITRSKTKQRKKANGLSKRKYGFKQLLFSGGDSDMVEEDDDEDTSIESRKVSSNSFPDEEFGDFFSEVEKAVDVGRNDKSFNGGVSTDSLKKKTTKRDSTESNVIDVEASSSKKQSGKRGEFGIGEEGEDAETELKAEDDEDDEDDEEDKASSVKDDSLDLESEVPNAGVADVGDDFDLDLSALGLSSELVEPTFHSTLAELLDDAKVVPVSVDGDLDVEISGIQHDSEDVNPGDLFVCCTGTTSDANLLLTEAFKRGAVAIIASQDIIVDDSVAVKALVMVENTNSILPALAASFFGHPSHKLTVIGLIGSNGKTTTTYILKSIYEAMGLKTGLLGSVACYIQDNHRLEASDTPPDAVRLQKLLAKMVHNGTEACVMEVSSHALAEGCCNSVDFDIAVFMNFIRDHPELSETESDLEVNGRLFEKMNDPERHRKVVNIDDPNASYFIAKGNPKVPVITFSMGSKDADVYALDVQLSLFETQVLIKTPKGVLEISSGLLGRENVYNILAAVAVGIAVGAPLDDIVKGIEEVDTVSGRCELIDEEQPFAVVVDCAQTPDALSRLLDTVRECGAKRLITVFGCGGEKERGKRPLMTKLATDKSEVCILTADNPRTEDPLEIIDDMLAGVGWTMHDYLKWGDEDYYPPLPNGHRLFVYDLRAIALRIGIAMAEPGDAVIIAGKGHEKYQIIGTEKKSFDDVEECREALQYVDTIHAAGINTSELPWRFPESY